MFLSGILHEKNFKSRVLFRTTKPCTIGFINKKMTEFLNSRVLLETDHKSLPKIHCGHHQDRNPNTYKQMTECVL